MKKIYIDEWPLIEHGSIVNYLSFSADTIASRRKTPTFTGTPTIKDGNVPDYGILPHLKNLKEICVFKIHQTVGREENSV